MSVRRLDDIPGFNIDRVAAAAGDDPDVLRLENLDTDIPPPAAAMEATRAAIGEDEANSWLPFTGRDDLKEAVAAFIERRGGPRYDGRREVVISRGEGGAMLDALFCLTDPGDEVILTDPTYAGMINRVRLVGAVPRLVPLHVVDGGWRLDLDALRAAVTDRTRAIFVNNASFPTRLGGRATRSGRRSRTGASRDLWLALLGRLRGRAVRRPADLPSGRAARDARPDGDRGRRPGVEQRMIAWRIGWVVAPGDLADDVARVTDLQRAGGRAASPRSGRGWRSSSRPTTWRPRTPNGSAAATRRCGSSTAFRRYAAAGGWSLLLDVAALGLDCREVSDRLLEQKVAATPMRGWGGEVADRHVRFVFSNEPVERLALLGDRVRRALAVAGQLPPGRVPASD